MRENPPPPQNGWVDVPHARIYWETSGAPDGVPVLYLHGGPGGTLGHGDYRKLHDLSRFRVIVLDHL